MIGMFVRRKLNKSGSISIRVLSKRNGRNVLSALLAGRGLRRRSARWSVGHDFINTYGGQTVFDFEAHQQTQRQTQLDNVFSRIVDTLAYKLCKELERLLHTLGVTISIDKALDIAKTISTVMVALPGGTPNTRITLMTEEQRQLQPLLPPLIPDLGDPLSKSGDCKFYSILVVILLKSRCKITQFS